MGKNKVKQTDPNQFIGKTQILEEKKRISRGYHKDNPTKSK
jgi:hypothetical protein